MNLSDSLYAVFESQSRSLATLRPFLSYVVGNHSEIRYQENSDGKIIEANQCNCLPEVPEGSNIQPVSVQFQCPEGEVSSINEQKVFNVTCNNDSCPRLIEDTCTTEIM